MDVKVITRHAPSNYGSLLQSLATIKIVERLGHRCSIIDYIRRDEQGIYEVLTPLKNKTDWNGNGLKRLVYIGCRWPETYMAQRKFERMRKNMLKLTNRCSTREDLSRLHADMFITGSDQVWGPTLNSSYDEAYFLSFVSETAKKKAYAASFGRTRFDDGTLKAYTRLLSAYSGIAVREDAAVELLQRMGIPCSGQVLDPTLLLTGDEWNAYIKREIQGEYVLVYQLHNNPQMDRYAKAFAHYVSLPLKRISPTLHQVFRGGKFIYLPDAGEFLSYIRNCTYFITDSFHGTAFAINFNKRFIEILPTNKTGSRNQSILQLTGLTDRILTDYNDFSLAEKQIDYAPVNAILAKEREKSVEILKGLLVKEQSHKL